MSLSSLRQARVDVSIGATVVSRISAIELRHGVGAARVLVCPTTQHYLASTTGTWPRSIDKRRWQLVARGVEAKGTLFRLRRGEWTRLRRGADVYPSEELVVLGVRSPMVPIVSEFRSHFAVGGNLFWTYWQVRVPEQPTSAVVDWLYSLGHALARKPWSVKLVTPPRALDEDGMPTFWVGDVPILSVHASEVDEPVLVRAEFDSTVARVDGTANGGDAFAAIQSESAGTMHFTAGTASDTVSVAFVQPPDHAALLEQLKNTPRVRVWVDELVIDAWGNSNSKVLLNRLPPTVRVDLGADDVRVSVTVWEHGRQRTSRALNAEGAQRVIDYALPTASRIELEANNLGRVVLVPTRDAVEQGGQLSNSDRLAWFDHATSLSSGPAQHLTTTLLGRPGASASLVVRRVSASALVRSRIVLRRRDRTGGYR